jgi:hypothetical protein
MPIDHISAHGERWRPFGKGELEVSDQGRIRWAKDKIIRETPNRSEKGYVRIGEKRLRVHRLVLTAFVGECPPGHMCRHLNGNPADNRLKNLRWGTQAENIKDRLKHGRVAAGERHGLAKLTERDVRTIRRAGVKQLVELLALKYGVTTSQIWQIRAYKSWVPDVLK